MITADNVCYKHILKNISFTADTGDITAVVGASGAGKTSLLQLIAGVYSPDTGAVHMNDARPLGFVYQNAADALSPARSLLAQMLEITDKQTAFGILDDLGIGDCAHTYGALLSGGQQMRAVIALNMALSPNVLLLDEATANLDDGNTQMVIDWVRTYAKTTAAVVLWVTHNMHIVSTVADKVLHLQQGQVVYSGDADSFLQNLPPTPPLQPMPRTHSQPPVASLDKVTVAYAHRPVLQDFSLHIEHGEIVGLYGASGRGKTTVLRTLLGQTPVLSGTVTCSPQIQKMQMIFQDAPNALNPRWAVYDSLYEAVPDKPHAQQHISDIIKKVGICANRLQDKPAAFSGGECQRLCIARAFIAQPDIILADEMTSALDSHIKTDILRLVQHLQRTYGVAMVFVSHSKATLEQVCNRIIQL